MKTKKFDKTLYDENDARAKLQAIKVLSAEEGIIVKEGTQYGTDIQCLYQDGSLAFMVECEVKKCWKTNEYSFEDINVPFRKKKNFDTNITTYMFMMNDIETSYLVIHKDDIINAPLKESPNKYNKKDEFFFAVPLDKADFHIGEL